MRRRLFSTVARASFNHWSRTYTADVTPKLDQRGYGYDLLADYIVESARKGRALEVGTGTGIVAERVKLRLPDLSIAGVDISDGMLAAAGSTGAYRELKRADAAELPYPDNTFALVYSTFMLHSSPAPERVIQEFLRVTEPGGAIVIVDLFRTRRRIPLISALGDNLHSVRFEHGAPSSYRSVGELVDIASRYCRRLEVVQLGERKRYTHFGISIVRSHDSAGYRGE